MEKRLTKPIPRTLRASIMNTLDEEANETVDPPASKLQKPTRCVICPRTSYRKTKTACRSVQRPCAIITYLEFSHSLGTFAFLYIQLWKTVYINTSYILNFIIFEINHHLKIYFQRTSFSYALIWLVPVSLLYIQLWKIVYINTSYILNFIIFENNHHLKSIDVQNTSSPLFTTCILHMQLWKTVYINTSYILNFILFENNHHLKSIDVQNTSSPRFNTCILHMQLWKTVYINTSYILNFILFENNHHLKSIDVQNTSSPLFTTCILHVTVSLL
nr:unnamed protein product [Callosobruchus analis]